MPPLPGLLPCRTSCSGGCTALTACFAFAFPAALRTAFSAATTASAVDATAEKGARPTRCLPAVPRPRTCRDALSIVEGAGEGMGIGLDCPRGADAAGERREGVRAEHMRSCQVYADRTCACPRRASMLLRRAAPAGGCACRLSGATGGCCAEAAEDVFPRTAAAQPRLMPAVVTAAMEPNGRLSCVCWR